jgi:hypothetical protein
VNLRKDHYHTPKQNKGFSDASAEESQCLTRENFVLLRAFPWYFEIALRDGNYHISLELDAFCLSSAGFLSGE